MTRGGREKLQDDPERKCIATGEVQPKAGLIRFCLGPDDLVVPDILARLPGRGFYVSATREAIEKAAKKGLFSRAARQPVKVPEGLADSKLMTAKRREAMVPTVQQWAIAYATGSATAAEVDKFGIMAAMSLAGSRALTALGVKPDIIILDGNTSFLREEDNGPRVITQVKADQNCACVSAASVIAKPSAALKVRRCMQVTPINSS